ncbi:protein air1-like [Gigantopelta aegis]|uniref:protein air1-like n=1 Tax=Gigantopelta aegis TaxID=1735272 RepID=UPI001B88BD4E|nr:protein air1-like [Gigantopelta aegis]
MKFKTVEGVEYFRVLRDNQLKVCYNCMSDSHVIKDCPDIVCNFCKEKGHYAKNCNKTFLCDKCGNKEEECVCSVHEDDSEWIDVSDSENDAMNEDVPESQVTVEKATQEKHVGDNKDKIPVSSNLDKQHTKIEFKAVKLSGSSDNKDADTIAKEIDNSQQRKPSRRSRLVKRPADEAVWSTVSTRKQKRQAARAKGVDESLKERRMSDCVSVDKN